MVDPEVVASRLAVLRTNLRRLQKIIEHGPDAFVSDENLYLKVERDHPRGHIRPRVVRRGDLGFARGVTPPIARMDDRSCRRRQSPTSRAKAVEFVLRWGFLTRRRASVRPGRPGTRIGRWLIVTITNRAVDPRDSHESGIGTMGIEERSRERRRRLVANRAKSFAEAEAWDLEFWQARSPEERLSALVAIRRDVELVEAARRKDPDGER